MIYAVEFRRHLHSNPELSFEELTDGVIRLLAPEGRFALILPPAEFERFCSASRGRLFVTRRCDVWSTPTSDVKRIMAEFQTTPPAEPATPDKLIIEEFGAMGYSEKYKSLTKDFYLKF